MAKASGTASIKSLVAKTNTAKKAVKAASISKTLKPSVKSGIANPNSNKSTKKVVLQTGMRQHQADVIKKLGTALRPKALELPVTAVPAKTQAKAPAPVVAPTAEAPEPKAIPSVDLAPWPFETSKKAVIRRRDWNTIVADVQKHGCREAEHEAENLHGEIKQLLDTRDRLQSVIDSMRAKVLKFSREFDAEFN